MFMLKIKQGHEFTLMGDYVKVSFGTRDDFVYKKCEDSIVTITDYNHNKDCGFSFSLFHNWSYIPSLEGEKITWAYTIDRDGLREFHIFDEAYVLNEQGKTVERIR